MKNHTVQNKKDINLPFVVFSAIFGALAVSAIIIYHVDKDAEWVEIYQMAMRWLVLPICSLVASYMGTLKKEPKGLMWICPVAFGAGISIVEWATYGSFSIVLLLMGALASLFGFTFAKMDRAEKARAAKAAKIRVAMESVEKPEESGAEASSEDGNPHSDFIPDEDDTWADDVIAREGFGDVKVDYAESDPDFSIDAPEDLACDETLEVQEDACEESVDADAAVEAEDPIEETLVGEEEVAEREREESLGEEQDDLDSFEDANQHAEEILEDDSETENCDSNELLENAEECHRDSEDALENIEKCLSDPDEALRDTEECLPDSDDTSEDVEK